MKLLISIAVAMMFVGLSLGSSHSFAREELRSKLENQRLVNNVARTNSNPEARKLLYNLLLDEFLEAAIEPEVEGEIFILLFLMLYLKILESSNSSLLNLKNVQFLAY